MINKFEVEIMFDEIKTFQKVYETKSITKTAKSLYISQPTVSVRIKTLEKELNINLFERKGKKGLVPTPNADQFYRDSQKILKTWEDSIDNLDIKYKSKKTKCVIGASELISDRILPKLMSRIDYLSNKYSFTLVTGSCDKIYSQLVQQQIDFALLEKPYASNEIEITNFMSNPFVLAGNESLSTWIIEPTNSVQYKYTYQYFRENHIRPTNLIRVNSDSLISKLLLQQVGRAIISKRIITNTQIEYQELPYNFYTDIYLASHKISKSNNFEKLKRILTVQLTQLDF
jgi:DNA-binding transcriptional LysR family regulator